MVAALTAAPQAAIESYVPVISGSCNTVSVIQLSDDYIEDYELICNTVMAEAGAECYKGQCAVAQCIMNAIEREGRPFSSIYKQYGYNSQRTASNDVKKAVKSVFLNGYKVTTAKIIVYYNPSICRSEWHESQRYICTIGNHRFFEMRG